MKVVQEWSRWLERVASDQVRVDPEATGLQKLWNILVDRLHPYCTRIGLARGADRTDMTL